MGFRPITSVKSLETGADFNSAVSSNFKSMYDGFVDKRLTEKHKHKPSKAFAPSQIRCNRLSFFRLRGVEPDEDQPINRSLEFQADLGTFCHQVIQKDLKDNIGDNFVDVEEYFNTHTIEFEYELTRKDEFETFIKFINPPVKFAVDGIIKIGEEYYLLEIKTSEYQSFKKLSGPKESHIDQAKCYASLLGLKHILFVYQDRLYGDIKCFEVTLQEYERTEIIENMKSVMHDAEVGVAPSKLPSGDYWCTYCKYKKRCKEWG